jgi:hypothetical protein
VKSKSISSINIDPYEAGTEIGDALSDIQPEAILLFASIHYADFSDLFEGIYDSLGTRDLVVLGGTGDGIYETTRVENVGVCALGFNAGGKIKWSLAIESDLSKDSFGAGQRCAQAIFDQGGDDLKLSFIIAGMAGDGEHLTAGIRSVMATPCIGGLTGDDRQYQQGIVLANGSVYENAVAILGLSGPLAFEMNLASGWRPIGQTGLIEEAHGIEITRINGMTTTEFVTQQFGKPPTEADMGVLTMAVYQNPNSDKFAIRSPYKVDLETGAITYFASIEEGTPVRVCYATREDVINGVHEAMDGLPALDFEPAAALVISCAGRKWILGNRTREEVDRILPSLPASLPLIGLPTFGEIAPHREDDGTYSGTYFHNVTYVITLLGLRA